MLTKRIFTLSTIAGIAALTAACGGSGTDAGSGTFSLAVTDGPIDSALHVVVQFDGVSIKPTDGEVIEFSFDEPRSLDLLALQGNLSAPLVEGEGVPAGDYAWIRLHVTAERDGIMDSYITMDDGAQLELWVPSGAQTGLKLVSGFTVAAGGNADFTVDFDLRKSIADPQGMPELILRPTLRLVNNMTVGSVAGTIDSNLVSQQCIDATLDDGSVYIFTGADAPLADIQGSEADPLVTALVHYDDAYTYEIGFLVEGDYTVAYTCDASSDNPTVADALTFVGAATVSVSSGTQSTYNFEFTEQATNEPVAE